MKTKSILMVVAAMLLSVSPALAQQGRSPGASERYDQDEVKTINGTVTKVDHPYATLKAEDGKEYQVHMGPLWYWQREKLELKPNVKAQIKGEVEEVKSAYHLYPWEIVQDGKTMALADEDGVPSWAGGRQRNEDCCMRCCRHGKGHGWR
jgi:hypothetical protein